MPEELDLSRIGDTYARECKEKFYSRREAKSYLAPLPRGYEGEFGPGIRSLVLVLYFGCNMSEPNIGESGHQVIRMLPCYGAPSSPGPRRS